MNTIAPFSISRVFNAPRALVFQASSDPAHLAHWIGPAGFKSIHAAGEIQPGKVYHYGIQGPDGSVMWGKQSFREVIPNEKLVYIQSFSDKDGGLTRHPFAPTWPLEMLATVTFEDAGEGKTKLTVTWLPYNADDAGRETFDSARPGMEQGFGGMFANLDTYLSASEKDLLVSRLVSAPRALVWEALTEPTRVNVWWGPKGFQNVEVEQDVRVGGVWKFKMVGPDGAVYPNKLTYLELDAPRRIVCDHGDFDNVLFRQVIQLDEASEGKTRVSFKLTFATKEARDAVLGYAIEGGQQTLAKLDAFLGN